MNPPATLKLGSIEQEHLQELYEAAGVPRDELPYSPALAQMCSDFQDRTFRNADEARVYAAILKYVRSSRCGTPTPVEPDVAAARAAQAAQYKAAHPDARKLQPYTPAFDAARAAYARTRDAADPELTPQEFWQITQLATRRGAPARRREPAVTATAAVPS